MTTFLEVDPQNRSLTGTAMEIDNVLAQLVVCRGPDGDYRYPGYGYPRGFFIGGTFGPTIITITIGDTRPCPSGQAYPPGRAQRGIVYPEHLGNTRFPLLALPQGCADSADIRGRIR